MSTLHEGTNPKGIFISHAHDDQDLVSALREMINDLYANFFDIFATSINPIAGGERWREEIRDSLERSRVALVIITPLSVNRIWIPFEAGAVWLDAVERKKTLIPCRFNYPDYTSPLAEFQGVDLLSADSIINGLILGLNGVSGLRTSDTYTDQIVEAFIDKCKLIKESPAYQGSSGQRTFDQKTKELFFQYTIEFFQQDKRSASKYMDMLRKHNILVDEESYSEFILKLQSSD